METEKWPKAADFPLQLINLCIKFGFLTHVGKYDRANNRPKLAMLAANVGYRYWTDDRSRLG